MNADGEAVISDRITEYYADGDVEGTHRTNRRGKIRVFWSINAVDAQSKRARLNYRAEINGATMEVYLRATPVGYRSNIGGRGHCRADS